MEASKRKNKSYYKQSGVKKRKYNLGLDVNMKGFLITCNNNEKQAVAEAYNILNEFADKVYGVEEKFKNGNSDSDDNIEASLQIQINSLKSNKSDRRFQNVDTNINNCIFIKTNLPDHNNLIDAIFGNDSGSCKARFIQRMLPVVRTCKVNEASIEKMAEEELLSSFANLNPAPTFSIIYKIRNNNSINKGIIYSIIGRVVTNINPLAKVNLDDPNIVISVDVLQKVCCLSILRHHKQYRKYNLHEMGNPKSIDEVSSNILKNPESIDKASSIILTNPESLNDEASSINFTNPESIDKASDIILTNNNSINEPSINIPNNPNSMDGVSNSNHTNHTSIDEPST